MPDFITINEIESHINEKTIEIKNKVNEVTTLINKGIKAVKTIQRGIAEEGVDEITIATVNPAKCVVLLNGEYTSILNNKFVKAPFVVSLSANKLVITCNEYMVSTYSVYGRVMWQVIEFY